MRRRLDLALSLVHEPTVLFLDEPTTGLDPTSRLALWDEVRRLNAEGTTVFLTTQYLEEADELAGRIAIIDGGRIVREGQPAVLKAAVGAHTLVVTVGARGGGRGPGRARGLRRRPRRRTPAPSPSASPADRPRCRARCGPSATPASTWSTSSSTPPASTTCSPTPPAAASRAPAAPRPGEGRRHDRGAPTGASRHEVRIGSREAMAQARGLAGRSIRGTLRQPPVWLPGLLFPMFIAAVNSSTMGKAIDFVPGFEGVPSLLAFLLAASITQSVLFGGLTAGSDTALDIQTGFFDRLLASPVPRTTILVGRLAGASATGALQAVVFIVVYGIFGVRVAAGAARDAAPRRLRHGAGARDRRVRRHAGAAHRVGRGGAERVPADVHRAVHQLGVLPDGGDDAAPTSGSPSATRSPG